ncbi:MAG TPA: cbb3-type cytochrome c oxidase N-terminal domain-containing protein [Agriterribacter sp.]|nr:cbb3-type cytochrome c oxidase N-terminal domain-containing protein [Agriterribacter sp.]
MQLKKRHPSSVYHLVKLAGITAWLLILCSAPAFASGPPAPSALSNPLALTLLTLMVILLIVIAMLGNLLVDIAAVKLQKEKEDKKKKAATTASIVSTLLLLSYSANAQNETAAGTTIGGLSAFAFYVVIAIIFVEILVILSLLINIKFLLKKETDKVFDPVPFLRTTSLTNLWNRLNKFKPIEEEAAVALDHDYDGIRELDNRLPPWWLYGFYVTIIFGVVYLWRYHVAYSAPLSRQEFEISVKKADEEVKAYLAKKGESVDENTVTVLTNPADLAEGKKIFITSCVACHKETGAGLVGPNLTDDYWLHGGSINNVFKVIKYGFNAMPQWQTSYSNKQVAQVASYVKSLYGTNPPEAKAPEGTLYKEEKDAASDSTTSK